MEIYDNKAHDVHITYIGGGSRGWAWNLMSDLAAADRMSGTVTLYDIDRHAADNNVIIGNAFKGDDVKGDFLYRAVYSLDEALVDADFVVISILPATFDEMESDVHAPEAYGIYQTVGDTTGPGGILRALRTMPMYAEIGDAIGRICPDAWVISYTNPMSVCVRTLYEVFPAIKAFGCCHEVFGTQELLAHIAKKALNVKNIERNEIAVNVQGVNHFTWLNKASYKGIDLMPIYAKTASELGECGLELGQPNNWMNNSFGSANCVKFDLFNRFNIIAAAGDRHLAEFCPGWYLKNPDVARSYKFSLTPVSWRKDNLLKLLAESERKVSGEEPVSIKQSGEEGVRQMMALMGLGDFTTNVNIPNYGQIPNVQTGVVVETNAIFSCNAITPVFAGAMQSDILQLTSPHIYMQNRMIEAYNTKSTKPAFKAFATNPLVHLSFRDAGELFNKMIDNTKACLSYYQE